MKNKTRTISEDQATRITREETNLVLTQFYGIKCIEQGKMENIKTTFFFFFFLRKGHAEEELVQKEFISPCRVHVCEQDS